MAYVQNLAPRVRDSIFNRIGEATPSVSSEVPMGPER